MCSPQRVSLEQAFVEEAALVPKPHVLKSSEISLRSKVSFVRRLRSFTTASWFSKPLVITPLACARLGWENVDADVIKCVSCGSIVCAVLPSPASSEYYGECVERLHSQLTEGHVRHCSWRSFACPASFMECPLDSPDFHDAFLRNCQSLADEQGLNVRPLLSGTLLQDITLLVHHDPLPVAEHLLPFALLGWSCLSGALCCELCLRQVFFRSGVSLDVDPLAAHAYWCPWSQEGVLVRLKNVLERWWTKRARKDLHLQVSVARRALNDACAKD